MPGGNTRAANPSDFFPLLLDNKDPGRREDRDAAQTRWLRPCGSLVTSVDDDFDAEIRRRWNEHIASLPPLVAETKRWKSGYWHNWFNAFRFIDDSDAVNHADILFAESGDDGDGDDGGGFNWIAEVEPSEVDSDSNHMWPTRH